MKPGQPTGVNIELGKFVVVRTYSAGVHVGTLAAQDGTQVRLTNARRVWAWTGANTLHEMAVRGCGEKSRISEAVAEITLTEAIEVIATSGSAEENLSSSRWTK